MRPVCCETRCTRAKTRLPRRPSPYSPPNCGVDKMGKDVFFLRYPPQPLFSPHSCSSAQSFRLFSLRRIGFIGSIAPSVGRKRSVLPVRFAISRQRKKNTHKVGKKVADFSLKVADFRRKEDLFLPKLHSCYPKTLSFFSSTVHRHATSRGTPLMVRALFAYWVRHVQRSGAPMQKAGKEREKGGRSATKKKLLWSIRYKKRGLIT